MGFFSEHASPQEMAEELTRTHDAPWIRALIAQLDRKLQVADLQRVMSVWKLPLTETAQIFGIPEDEMREWLKLGPPPDRMDAVTALADATTLLERYVKQDRIPIIVRRPSNLGSNKSLIELARTGQYETVLTTTREMFDLCRHTSSERIEQHPDGQTS